MPSGVAVSGMVAPEESSPPLAISAPFAISTGSWNKLSGVRFSWKMTTTCSILLRSELTVIGSEVPVIETLTVSVAVMVWLPVVISVAEKVMVPFASVESGGSNA